VSVVDLQFANLPLQVSKREFPAWIENKIMPSLIIYSIPMLVILLLWIIGIVEINLF